MFSNGKNKRVKSVNSHLLNRVKYVKSPKDSVSINRKKAKKNLK